MCLEPPAAGPYIFSGATTPEGVRRMALTIPPDSTDFVVVTDDPKLGPALLRRLADLGHVEPIRGHPGLFIVTPRREWSDTADRLRQALEGLDADVRVETVLEDERGNRVVPTGTVTVRFESEPSAAELKRFAGPLGLTVVSRNKFVPSQVSFRVPAGVCDRVTDIVDRIRQHGDRVVQAWPETLGVYRRARPRPPPVIRPTPHPAIAVALVDRLFFGFGPRVILASE